MDMVLHTYGGGEILYKLFNAIAMLMNNKGGGITQPMMIISISIASIWTITKAFFSPSIETILGRYFFPIIAIIGIFLIPTKTVRIEDAVTQKYYKIDHVPFLLAQFSQFSSSLGYRMTEAIEAVMHTPNDVKYNTTGMIFGSESALEMSKFIIHNGDFQRNLNEFSKQCVFYDLLLGRYTIEEMQKSTDLWKLFSEKTSKVRMIDYIDPNSKTAIGTAHTITCQEAVKRMAPFLENEKRYYVLQDIGKNLPFVYQALTKMKEQSEDLIGQQVLMEFFKEGFDSKGFAMRRAHAQTQSTYHALGALASSSLISMRAVIEGLVYSAFIFVLPLSVLPMGLRFLSTWIWLIVWIQLWPPFFAILTYIMQAAAQAQADSIFSSLGEGEKGLSFFTSAGLLTLHQDISALSGYLAASIPFISYAILQGGVSSFIHLAGSMMTPVHSAATSAAAEQSSGSYSYANINYGQEHFKNRTAFQNTLAPSLSSGYITHSDGVSSTTYGSETILRQGTSEFRNNLFSDESLSSSFSRSMQDAETYTRSSQTSLNDSLSNHARNYGDMTYFLSQGENVSENLMGKEGVSVQESANTLISEARSFANQHGLSERTGMDILVGGGIGIKANLSDSNITEETWNASKNISQSEGFQKHFQNVQDFASSASIGSLNDKGVRVVEGYTNSRDAVVSAQEQYQSSLSNLQQVSESSAFVESLSVQQKKNLNQDFINWGSEKFAHEGGYEKMKDLILHGSDQQMQPLIQEFLLEKVPHDFGKGSINPERAYNDSISHFESFKSSLSDNKHMDNTLQLAQSIIEESYSNSHSTSSDSINDKSQILSGEAETTRSKLEGEYTDSKSSFNDKQEEYQHYNAIKKVRNTVGNFVGTTLSQITSSNSNPKIQSSQENQGVSSVNSNSAPFWYAGKEK